MITTLGQLYAAAADAIERDEVYCGGICSVVKMQDAPPELRTRACAIIMDRLDGAVFYPIWIHKHHPRLMDGLHWKESRVKVREGRIAWCRSLAEEFA